MDVADLFTDEERRESGDDFFVVIKPQISVRDDVARRLVSTINIYSLTTLLSVTLVNFHPGKPDTRNTSSVLLKTLTGGL